MSAFSNDKAREALMYVTEKTGPVVKGSPSQAQAWNAIFVLCLELGMDTDSEESAIEMVARFIAELHDRANSDKI